MDLGANIGNGLSDIGKTICSGIISVCSAIGDALFSNIGGIATLAVSFIMPGVGLPEILLGIEIIAAIVSAVAEALGLKDKDETSEEMGIKAEAADKKPEDFDSIEKYIEYLRNEVQIDKDKLNNLSNEDKVKYAAIGTAINIKGIEEKYKISASREFWGTMVDLKKSGKLSEEETKQYIESCKQNGITDMEDMSDYIKGEAPKSGTESSVVSGAIMDALKKANPELSGTELVEKFNNLHL